MEIKKVGVLGCGLMGHGITQVAAQAGYDVVVREVDQAKLDKGLGRIEKQLARAVEKGRMEQADADAVRGRITGHARLRRPGRLRPRDRGHHREPRAEARDVARGGPDREAGGGVRHEHLVAGRDRPGGGDRAPGALPRAPLLQPGAGDEARGGGAGHHHLGRDLRGGPRLRRLDRQARHPDPRHGGLHREPAAGALHARRHPRVRGGRGLGGGDRRRHEGRRRPSDGPAHPVRLRGPGHARARSAT